MKEYEKIETIFARDINGTKLLMDGVFRDPTVQYLANVEWIWTEKVDGTNIRVYWDGHSVSFAGRTDNANLPTPLANFLMQKFGSLEAEEVFEQLFGDREVILFGEGYGNKIQSVGKDYIPDGVGFIMFDLLINNNYQTRQDVENCAKAFDVPVVPVIGEGTLYQAIDFVKTHPKSTIGTCDMEGVVCRPKMELRDRCGNRVIVKIKWRDFKELVYNAR